MIGIRLAAALPTRLTASMKPRIVNGRWVRGLIGRADTKPVFPADDIWSRKQPRAYRASRRFTTHWWVT